MPRESAAVGRAVVLYGRVGTYSTRTATMKKGLPADENLWRACAESINQHVVKPWSLAGRVDVFVQSWNPELADAMATFWQPSGADHAAQNRSLGRCPVRLNYCDRTMWALLGMKRALALRTRWAASAEGRAAGAHATVLVMRHDVIWSNTMPPLRADRSVRLWLPFDCQRASCRDQTARAADLYSEGQAPPRAACAEMASALRASEAIVLRRLADGGEAAALFSLVGPELLGLPQKTVRVNMLFTLAPRRRV